MGFLDNLIKAVESGELEKRLENVADRIENMSEKVTEKVEKVADVPKKVIDPEAASQE